MVVIKDVNLIPASFAEVCPQLNSDLYTRGKLDVFYVGETPDHRKFTDEFSKKLIQSIAYTPVVSHYNEEKDDFEGHAEEQDIYGLVDPMVPPTFVEHDGATWARCDVILYTKRPDKTGEIASKIIGHAQSLELRPDTLKYKINRDAQGNFKNLEFLDGQFIGVSVLGKDQQPAFTGSHFFEALPAETFIRGKEMTLTIQEFAKLSWGEQIDLLSQALYNQYGENFWCIIDVYDNMVVYRVYDEEAQRIRMYRMKYKLDAETVSFKSEPEEVHPSYEKLALIDTDGKKRCPENEGVNLDIADEENKEEPATPSEPEDPEEPSDPEDPAEPEDPNDPKDPEDPAEPVDPEPTEPSEPSEPGEATTEPENNESGETEPGNEDEDGASSEGSDPKNLSLEEAGQKGSDEENNSTTTVSLSNAEQAELAAYRKEKKIGLINSYADVLAAEDIKNLIDNVDTYTLETLKPVLDALFVTATRKKEAVKPEAHASNFTWYPSTPKGNKSEYAEYIGNLLKK